MRLAVFGAVSTTLAVAIVVNAFLANKQFFSSCVHLTRSAANMMVLLNMGLFLTILEGRALVRLFFGELRTIEVEVKSKVLNSEFRQYPLTSKSYQNNISIYMSGRGMQ